MRTAQSRPVEIADHPLDGTAFSPRQEVEAYCQALVDAGQARWAKHRDGDAELRLHSGEIYLFGELGLTRLA